MPGSPPSTTAARTARAAPSRGSPLAWLMAIRPPSLALAFGPVILGAGNAYARTGALDPGLTLAILAAAVLVHVACNLQNDLGFTERGGERVAGRPGLPRATGLGVLGAAEVRLAIAAIAAVATAIGLALYDARGWPVLVIGTASLVVALAYMGGPRPLGYTPFGELTVLVFFGPVAVVGTDWMLSGSTSTATVVASIASGMQAAAALAANNHRDRAHDTAIGRRTFAVAFGGAASRRLCRTLLIAPLAAAPILAVHEESMAFLLPLLAAPALLRLSRELASATGSAALTPLVTRTFALAFVQSILLAAASVAAGTMR